MPRRRDLESICLIGSGPIVIGQACEFDYSGCQALKVLREDGFRTIVVNSNPATIMTDPGFADRTYLEPLDLEGVAAVLEPRAARRAAADDGRPDRRSTSRAELADDGRARRARDRADRRAARRDPPRRGPRALPRRGRRAAACGRRSRRSSPRSSELGGSRCPRSSGPRSRSAVTAAASSDDERRAPAPGRDRAPRVADQPGARRGVDARLGRVRARGDARPARQRRDRLLDREPRPDGRAHRRLGHGRAADDAVATRPTRSCATRPPRSSAPSGSSRGGSNIQFARDRDTGELRVIEMNPRVSRSSALASKATGYPIAKVAAKLAVGYTLDEIPNDLTKTTPASFEPTLDYVVVKFPRFAFEKFPGADRTLGTQMKSRRRDDGHRPHLHRGVPEGDALARARRTTPWTTRDARDMHPWFVASSTVEAALGTVRSLDDLVAATGCDSSASASPTGRLRSLLRDRGRSASRRRPGGRARLPPGRLVRRRGRGRVELPVLHLGRGRRGAARARPLGRDPRLRPEPDRPGDRVRLLLRARRADLPRARVRGRDGQLQPGDRLHRLRHVATASTSSRSGSRRCWRCWSASSRSAS